MRSAAPDTSEFLAFLANEAAMAIGSRAGGDSLQSLRPRASGRMPEHPDLRRFVFVELRAQMSH